MLPLPIAAPQLMAVLLTLLAIGAFTVAVRTVVGDHERRTLLDRLAVRHGGVPRSGRLTGSGADLGSRRHGATLRQRFALWLDGWLPERLTSADIDQRLARAGLHGADAGLLFAFGRVMAPLIGLLAALPLLGGPIGLESVVALAVAVTIGLVLPTAVLDRLVSRRQHALRLALPDALDLMIVCLEAGVSIDAALVRVSRELERVHPALAEELASVNRRVSAGLPRDEALRGLWTRTGIDELRSLTATMVQAERLGTSFGRVLRIHTDAMRTRRRQHAETRAAQASVKMIFPLVLLLLPAFFAVVLGPAVMALSSTFGKP